MANSAVVGILKALLTCDTSEFTKAMGSASADVQKLGSSMEKDLEPRQRAINNLVRDFIGSGDIGRANEYAAAVEKIGGAAKLTEQDQTRVNKVVSEALAHYQALGTEAPQHLIALEQATRQPASALDQLRASLDSVGLSLSGLTIAGVVGGIGAIGKEAIELAGHLEDLHASTGISVEDLQLLAFAGGQVGVGLDQVASGVQKFQKGLVEGGKPAQEALERLHLSAQNLLAMDPARAFEAVGTAISTLPDPAQRSAVAMELLGKSGAELLPLLTSNIKDLEKGAVTMSDSAVAGLDKLGDTWDSFKKNLEAGIGEGISHLTSLRGAFEGLSGVRLNEVADEVADTTKKMADSLEAAAVKTSDLVPKLKSAKDAEAEFNITNKDAEASMKKGWQEADNYKAKIAALADTFTGKDLVQKVKDYDAAVKAAGGTSHLTAYEQEQLGKQLIELERQGAKLPPVLQDIADKQVQVAASSEILKHVSDDVLASLEKQHAQLRDFIIPTLDSFVEHGKGVQLMLENLAPRINLPAPPITAWQIWHDDVQHATNDLVGNLEGSFSDITRGWGAMLDDLKHTGQNFFSDMILAVEHQWLEPMLLKILGSQGAFGKAIGGLFSGGASAASGAASGVGGAVSAASGAGGAAGGGAGAGGGALAGIGGAIASYATGIGIVAGLIARPGYWGENNSIDMSNMSSDQQQAIMNYGPDAITRFPDLFPDVPSMDGGGLIMRDTLASLHAGEAVVPLRGSGMGGGNIVSVVQVDGREIARATRRYTPADLINAGF